MDNRSYIRVPKRWVHIAMVVTVTALIVAPLTAWAGHVFTDVPDSNTFHDDIAWLADSGVTKGCNPPANDQFCPDGNVSRGQMSAFMRRFAKYIDAEDGTPAQADRAATADDAGTLDGVDSSGFLRNDTVVFSQSSTAWVANQGVPPSSGGPYTNVASYSGDGYIQMSLPTPASIGGTTYGLEKLEICYRVNLDPGYIDFVRIYRGDTSGSAQIAFTDDDDRSSGTWGCFTVQPNLIPKRGLNLVVRLNGGGNIYMGNVRATWSSDLTGMTSDGVVDVVEDPAARLGE